MSDKLKAAKKLLDEISQRDDDIIAKYKMIKNAYNLFDKKDIPEVSGILFGQEIESLVKGTCGKDLEDQKGSARTQFLSDVQTMGREFTKIGLTIEAGKLRVDPAMAEERTKVMTEVAAIMFARELKKAQSLLDRLGFKRESAKSFLRTFVKGICTKIDHSVYVDIQSELEKALTLSMKKLFKICLWPVVSTGYWRCLEHIQNTLLFIPRVVLAIPAIVAFYTFKWRSSTENSWDKLVKSGQADCTSVPAGTTFGAYLFSLVGVIIGIYKGVEYFIPEETATSPTPPTDGTSNKLALGAAVLTLGGAAAGIYTCTQSVESEDRSIVQKVSTRKRSIPEEIVKGSSNWLMLVTLILVVMTVGAAIYFCIGDYFSDENLDDLENLEPDIEKGLAE